MNEKLLADYIKATIWDGVTTDHIKTIEASAHYILIGVNDGLNYREHLKIDLLDIIAWVWSQKEGE